MSKVKGYGVTYRLVKSVDVAQTEIGRLHQVQVLKDHVQHILTRRVDLSNYKIPNYFHHYLLGIIRLYFISIIIVIQLIIITIII